MAPTYAIKNRVVPVLEVSKDGAKKTVWKDYSRSYKSFFHYQSIGLYYPERDKTLPRGGIASLKRRRDALLDRIGNSSSVTGPAADVRSAFRNRDPHLMTAYEKYVTKENQHEAVSTVGCCVWFLREMGIDPEVAIPTHEHVELYVRVYDVVRGVSQELFPSDEEFYFETALRWVIFDNMSLASRILSLVEEHGVTDVKVILDMLPELSAAHQSLCDGVL